MIKWAKITLAVASIGIPIIFLIVFIWRFRRHAKTTEGSIDTIKQTADDHHVSLGHIDITKNRRNYYIFRRGSSTKSLFSWSDHPCLVSDAVENGWSQFAFTIQSTVQPVRSPLSFLGACAAAGNHGGKGVEMEMEISWEVCQGSADFMQKIRLNPGSKKINISNNSSVGTTASSVIRTALPLPGPPLGNSPFPQESYFEITILSPDDNDSIRKPKGEGEKTMLIQENSKSKSSSESLFHGSINKIEELRHGDEENSKSQMVMMCLGLTAGGSLPLKLPGSYPGSIGFSSNGSVYLDGTKIVLESEKQYWGMTDKVIGCGYSPSQRKVFFTVDSQLAHVIPCKYEEFSAPLYPTLAANTEVMVLVNLGQSVFKYAQANEQRNPNPCFIGPMANSSALGNEDSKELFSMGGIDSQWLNRSAAKSVQSSGSNNKRVEFDQESEGEFFEIVLDGYGRSPNTIL